MSIRTSLILTALALVVALVAPSAAHAEQSRGLVIESHVGERPRDADYLLSPLLDELKKNGFPGSSVAGTRIHSKHSVSSAQLTQKQIDTAKRDVKDAHAAFINLQFQDAVQTGNRALKLLMSRPATMARQQQVRDHLYNALIVISMANSRLGKNKARDESMGEFIRSFPDRDVSVKKYGPEGADLYRQINKRMSAEAKGELQIAAGSGSMIFVNERYVGIGSLKLDLFPGQYRIYTQNGPAAGRVHIVEVQSERKQTLVVDKVVDKSLRTSDGFVGLVFADEEERSREERRVTVDLGNAIGAKEIILVGFHKIKGRDSIVASALSVENGESGLSARVPLPKNGAPTASQLRSLAAFVTGSKPASPGIEVFTVEDPIVLNEPAGAPTGKLVRDAKFSDAGEPETGISPAWRWGSWGLGAVGLGVGGYLLAIDGEGSCDLQPGQMICPESYDTFAPGIALLGAGAALGGLGFYLWTKEESSTSTRLSLVPTQEGWSAALSGRF
jgi:hypothetical protein